MANEDKAPLFMAPTSTQLYKIIENTLEAMRVKVVEGTFTIEGFSTESKQDIIILSLNNMLGQNGSTFINDTGLHSGDYVGLHVVENCVFETLTDSGRDGNSLGSQIFYRGMVLTGNITEIKLVSGVVIAYKR